MKKFLSIILTSLLLVTPTLAETAPTLGTDEYCWSTSTASSIADRHDSYFKEITLQNPTGCFYRYNVAWHEKYDEKVFLQPQNVPYVNDLTSRTMKVTDIWGSEAELKAKLCTAGTVSTVKPVSVSLHLPTMEIGTKSNTVAIMQDAFQKLGLMKKPKVRGTVDLQTSQAFDAVMAQF